MVYRTTDVSLLSCKTCMHTLHGMSVWACARMCVKRVITDRTVWIAIDPAHACSPDIAETCMSCTVGDFALHLGLKGVEKIDNARAPVAQLVRACHLTGIQRTQAWILAGSQCLFLTSWPAFSLVADNVFFGLGMVSLLGIPIINVNNMHLCCIISACMMTKKQIANTDIKSVIKLTYKNANLYRYNNSTNI